jgi:excisionase family DNA binding protein
MIMAIRDNTGRTLISCREAAELYPCSMRYIRKLVQSGRLVSQEVGGTYMVDRAEVLAISRRKATGRLRKRSEGFRAG